MSDVQTNGATKIVDEIIHALGEKNDSIRQFIDALSSSTSGPIFMFDEVRDRQTKILDMEDVQRIREMIRNLTKEDVTII